MYSASNPTASNTVRAASQHSTPMPSPGSHAIRYFAISSGSLVLLYQVRNQSTGLEQFDRPWVEPRGGISAAARAVDDLSGGQVDIKLVASLDAADRRRRNH